MADVPTPETLTGPAAHWLNILDKGHDLLAGRIDGRKKQHVEDVLHQLEGDLAPLIGPIVDQVLANPAASDELKALLAEAGSPQHQFGSLVVGFAIGSVVGPVLGAVLAPEIEGIAQEEWRSNPDRPITPDVLVAAALKNVHTPYTGDTEAARSGTNTGRFATMVEAAGQPEGLGEALLLWRRGDIDDAGFTRVLEYSNVNPKFYPEIRKLKFVPPSVGEVITSWLKGHMDPNVALGYLVENGIDPNLGQILHDSAGRPLGLEETLHLLNRGVVDEQFVRQSIKQSDINDAYTEAALQLRHYFPPPRSVVPMLRSGAITEAEARTLLGYYGVGEPWASAYVAEAHHTSSTHVKELSQAQVVRMYSVRLYDRATANAKLLALKYTQADVTLLLDFADDERHERTLNATITKVGTKYVAHRLTVAEATHLLNVAGVPNAAQHDLFALWDVQRTANVVVPSASMVVGAYRRGDISALETKQRLLALGVQPADLDIFVADGYPPPKKADQVAAVAAVVNA